MCDVNKTTRAITCGSTYAHSHHYCKSTACIKDRHIRSHTSDICARQKRKSLTHLANPDPAPEAAPQKGPTCLVTGASCVSVTEAFSHLNESFRIRLTAVWTASSLVDRGRRG